MGAYEHNDAIESTLDGAEAKRCALLVIDELGEVEGGPLEDVLLQPTLNSARIADAARANGIPVIFVNDAHFEGMDHELELWGNHNIAGTPEAQPSPQLNLQDGDFVIDKPKYSGFYQTRLRSLLRDLGADTLVLVGFDTNICVVHTAASAYFEGFKLVVVEDATATFLVGNQADGLEYMKRCYAAKVASTDEVLALFDGRSLDAN